MNKAHFHPIHLLVITITLLAASCSPGEAVPTPATQKNTNSSSESEASSPVPDASNAAAIATADILSVQTTGDENTYRFAVEISSPDTGCEQYADWWEVITEDGRLLYRRILAHSHVSEQPFTRSGGPVEIDAHTTVILRAHMNPGGYGGQAFSGSADGGYAAIELADDFAADLAISPPLPSGCGG